MSNPKKGQTMLFIGDLSYADDHPFHNNVRWDTWGRFIERSAAYQPWIWVSGNHELDYAPEIVRNFLFEALFIFLCQPCMNSSSSSPIQINYCNRKWFTGDLFQGETRPFKPYLHRYYVPYKDSQSTSPLWYSIRRASAHIIILSSYSAYGKNLEFYSFVQKNPSSVTNIMIVNIPKQNVLIVAWTTSNLIQGVRIAGTSSGLR